MVSDGTFKRISNAYSATRSSPELKVEVEVEVEVEE